VKVIGRNLLLGPLAFAGAIAGHSLGYLVSHPGAHERSAALIGTGHGSFGRLTAVAVATGVGGLVALTVRACRRQTVEFRWLASRLAALQLAIFAVLELAERDFDPGRTVDDPAVLLGLAAQVLVALGAAVLARGVQDVVRSIRSEAPPTPRAPSRFPRPATRASRRTRLDWLWEARRRAPPVPLTG
jgi:hypothetical protein